mmetsp:Transcript_13068/g.18007  ORF Transcript_13068/g.18007 Transcript_13068/m.18007 type:complete len:107 (-) Transcript_13068:308-628(-)
MEGAAIAGKGRIVAKDQEEAQGPTADERRLYGQRQLEVGDERVGRQQSLVVQPAEIRKALDQQPIPDNDAHGQRHEHAHLVHQTLHDGRHVEVEQRAVEAIAGAVR